MDARASGLDRFFRLLEGTLGDQTLVKLTLGKHRGPDASLRNLFIRPVVLRGEWQLSFLYRHETKDVTKNYRSSEALALLRELVPAQFRDAHLFTPAQTAQLSCEEGGSSRLKVKLAPSAPAPAGTGHDRVKHRLIPEQSPWLVDLGVTLPTGKVREDMMPKFRQINRFVELVDPLVREAKLTEQNEPFHIVDMGCGKGYLTFALAAYFGTRAHTLGIEVRPELVEAGNRAASRHGLAHLRFSAGQISSAEAGEIDLLIALHACDTATDDALFAGVQKQARVIVVSPCCQKEVRAQLKASAVLAPALRHGIFAERHAEFATDALRALLLEAAGYQTRVFEFITTEHTAKNLMIAAVKDASPDSRRREKARADAQALASFYGIQRQRLAGLLEVPLSAHGI